MAIDFNTYDTTNSPTGPEKPRVFGLKVIEDIDVLRTCGLNEVVTLKKGYLQAFEDGSNRIYFKIVREDGTTVKEAMAGEYFLREDLDFDGQTAIVFRVEDVDALALAAANDGIVSRHPTNRRLIKNGPLGGVRHYLSEWSYDGISYKRIHCEIEDLDDDLKHYADAKTEAGPVTQVGVGTTPVKLTTFDTNGPSLGAVPDHTLDRITVAEDGLYYISGQISIESSANKTYGFYPAINGIAGALMSQADGKTGEVSSVSAVALVEMTEGDYLEIFVDVDTGTADITVDAAQVVVQRIGPLAAKNQAAPTHHGGSDGLLMSDALDSAYWATKVPLPADYSETHDVLLEALVTLESAETSTDAIDLKTGMEKALIGTEGFDGTLTNYSYTPVAIGAGGVAAGTFHRVIIPMTYNDATNPLATDAMLRGVVQRDGLLNIGDIVIHSLNLLVPCYGGVDHQ